MLELAKMFLSLVILINVPNVKDPISGLVLPPHKDFPVLANSIKALHIKPLQIFLFISYRTVTIICISSSLYLPVYHHPVMADVSSLQLLRDSQH